MNQREPDEYAARRAETMRDQTRTGEPVGAGNGKLTGRKVPCLTCGEPVEVSVGCTDAVTAMNGRLYAQGMKQLMVNEVVRCPKCYEVYSKDRAAETEQQLKTYRKATTRFVTRENGFTEKAFLDEMQEYAPDWYQDGVRFAGWVRVASEAAPGGNRGGQVPR